MALGILGKITAGAVLVLLILAIVAASLYAMDYGVKADVVDKDCRALGASTVTVQERFLRFEHTQPINLDECTTVVVDNFVVYNIRSGRLRIYVEEGGPLIWDSQRL